ncbi:MAG: glycosyltransferase [Lachnospiraceae bacterium]|nr:glycosyltransferase [Lachnospiraceae bacterium]
MSKKPIPSVDVVIPTYHPGKETGELLKRLKAQTLKPRRILIINTEEEFWDPALAEGIPEAEVFHIKKQDFDHAATRNMGAELASGDYLLFMTQDAMPAGRKLLKRLQASFEEPGVAAAYARQLPAKDCRPIERYTRRFNYPPESRVKSLSDLPELGVKTFFCSNVCAMYDRKILMERKGFAAPCIFNEDMIFAGRAVRDGLKIAYVSGAGVIHSHNYSALQQFHRNFDNGVSQVLHPEVFGGLSSMGEGGRLVKGTAAYLLASGHILLLPELFVQSAAKLAGFKLGRAFRLLPKRLILAAAMNKDYWK